MGLRGFHRQAVILCGCSRLAHHSWRAVRDRQLADAAVARPGELKDDSFSIAVGFHKPDLPFIVPRRYFNLYGRDDESSLSRRVRVGLRTPKAAFFHESGQWKMTPPHPFLQRFFETSMPRRGLFLCFTVSSSAEADWLSH